MLKSTYHNIFGVMLKTYSGDYAYVERLINSYNRFNEDQINLFVVVPENEKYIFEKFKTNNIFLLSDEDITTEYLQIGLHDHVKEGRGIINAGVTKLAFWETGLCENYFAIDSDMVFIRPFKVSDFLDEEGNPYTVLSNYPELHTDPFYNNRYWDKRSNSYKNVKKEINLLTAIDMNTCCSQVMSSNLLREMKEEFFIKNNWKYVDAMIYENYEFFWYAAWAQKSRNFKLTQINDLVKIIHHQGEHLMLHNAGYKKNDLSREYIGVIVNSNWSRQYGLVDFDQPPIDMYYQLGAWAKWIKSIKDQA